MSGAWETNRRPAGWRRAVAPAALVIAGLLAGVVAFPGTYDPTLPLDIEPPAAPEPEPAVETGAAGRWAPMSAGPLATRQLAASAWTGDELIVWGGRVAVRGRWFADGAAYDPRTDRWRRLPRAPLRARAGASAVWTGTEFIVWGGAGAADGPVGPRGFVGAGVETARTTQAYADGAAYNPRTNRWRRLAAAPLAPRRDATMVWTGREAVVWGGTGVGRSSHEPDGARYDPVADRWAPVRGGPLGRAGNRLVQAVALGRKVLVWASDFTAARTALYDPASDRWRHIPAPALEPGVVPSIASVAGGVMLWGGWRFSRRAGSRPLAVRYTTTANRWVTVPRPPYAPVAGQPLVAAGPAAIAWQAGGGVVFDVLRSAWQPLPEGPRLPPDTLHAWADDRLLLWSPAGRPDTPGRAAAWVPDNPWRTLPEPPAAIDAGGAAVWSGWLREDQQVLVWGGLDHGSHEVGAAYDPEIALWEAIRRPPLSRRVEPAAAWLAPEMIVVGGRDLPDAPALRDAAAFNARERTWRRLPDAPMAVAGSAVVAGREQLYAAGLSHGDVAAAVYRPGPDRWAPLPPPPIPAGVDRLHAAWTEFELWVWGTRPDGEGAGAAWSPLRRRWRALPRLRGMTGRLAWAWAGNRVFVLGGDGATASLGRGGTQWLRYPRSPVRSDSAATVWSGNALLAFAPEQGKMAILDPRSSSWVRFPAPFLPRHHDGRLLWTGRDVYAFAGDGAAELAR